MNFLIRGISLRFKDSRTVVYRRAKQLTADAAGKTGNTRVIDLQLDENSDDCAGYARTSSNVTALFPCEQLAD